MRYTLPTDYPMRVSLLYCERKIARYSTTLIFFAAMSTTVLAQSGSVIAWGDNSYGQTNLPSGLSNIVTLAAGANHTVALRNDGIVLSWGDDSMQQVTLPVSLTTAMAIGAGANHSLAVRSNGTVVVWGDNTYHQTN